MSVYIYEIVCVCLCVISLCGLPILTSLFFMKRRPADDLRTLHYIYTRQTVPTQERHAEWRIMYIYTYTYNDNKTNKTAMAHTIFILAGSTSHSHEHVVLSRANLKHCCSLLAVRDCAVRIIK